MTKKVPGPLRGSLFNPLRIGGPDLLNTAALKSTDKDDKRISRNTLIDILKANSVQYNNDLMDDLQDLSTRTQFASNDVRRIFTKNKLPIPTEDTLRKITGAIKQRKNQKKEVNARTNTKSITNDKRTSRIPILNLENIASIQRIPGVGIAIKFYKEIEKQKILKFPGIDFELISDSTGKRLEEKIAQYLNGYDKGLLQFIYEAESPESINDALSWHPNFRKLSTEQLINTIKFAMLKAHGKSIARNNPESLDPKNTSQFDQAAWYFHVYLEPIENIIEKYADKKTIPTSELTEWIRNVTRHVDGKLPSLDTEKLIAEKKEFTPVEISRLCHILINELIKPMRIFIAHGAHGKAMSMSIPQLTKKIKTPCRLEVPTYRTYQVCGNYGVAFAWSNCIIISTENEIDFEADREDYKKWWAEYKSGRQWPSLKDNPVLIPFWVLMNTYGLLTLEEGEDLFEKFILAEEAWHVDTFKYMQDTVDQNLFEGIPGYHVECIKTILREDNPNSKGDIVSFWKELDSLSNEPKKQDELATVFVKVEGKLGALQTTPTPVVELVDDFANVIIPQCDHMSRASSFYLNANSYLARLLSVEFFGYETLDPKIWLPFITEKVKDKESIEKFGEEIKEAATKAHKTKFLTHTERDVKNPSWRSDKKKVLI